MGHLSSLYSVFRDGGFARVPKGDAMMENITAAQAYLKPFPAFEDVFAEPLTLHRKHFLPLISVDASVVYPDLDLWLHFVTPIEPLLELDVGYFTQGYHDFYNRDGQFAFAVTNGRYAFAGDFRYFAYESGEIFRAFPNKDLEIHADYQRRISSYEETRRGFQKHGRLPWCADSPHDPSRGFAGPLADRAGCNSAGADGTAGTIARIPSASRSEHSNGEVDSSSRMGDTQMGPREVLLPQVKPRRRGANSTPGRSYWHSGFSIARVGARSQEQLGHGPRGRTMSAR
jgi:hypothetical protein